MARTISLDGIDWLLKGYVGEDWLWRDAHKPGTRDLHGWVRATVPGTVQNDLWEAGEIPDPYFERNTLLCEWVPQRTWLYKKSFTVGTEEKGRRLTLVFDGVDYEAEFFLNGETLGRHRGMYTPVEYDISERVRYGEENLLAVVVAPAPHEVPQVGRTSEVRTHKARMNYGWDCSPRLVHVGIWDHAFIEVTGPVRLEDVWVRPRLSDDLQRAELGVETKLDAAAGGPVEIEVTVRLGGEVAATGRTSRALERGRTTVGLELPPVEPRLWWPNGLGEQPLYEAEVRVHVGGEEADARRVRFGIRRLELTPNETSDATARPYTLVVNGQKVYLKGWNWVPLDVMYGVERPDKLDRLLTLAQRAHVNLFRVWGGGLIEKEEFYAECDRRGIMVWQEFIQSSSGIASEPSDDPAFVEMMAREAEQIIPRKRNHPSLVLWCGGNELQAGAEQPLDERAPVLDALRDAVRRLDPDRLWLPTSPSGRVFGNELGNIARDPTGMHDVHGPWEYQGLEKQYELYNRGTSLLHSEFGAEGITNLRTLNAVMAGEHQMPFSRANGVWAHLGAWWVNEAMLREVFGEVEEIEPLARASQFLQAEGLRYAVEADERRMFQNSGTIPWQFNEPYPNAACTCAVDYYGEPKAAYYAVARAYEPVHVSARYPRLAWAGQAEFEAEVWVANTRPTELTGARLTARLVGFSGREYAAWESRADCAALRAQQVLAVRQPLAEVEEIFILDLALQDAAGRALSQNRYVYTRGENLAALLAEEPTRLKVARTGEGNVWEVEALNAGSRAALFVTIEDARDIGAAGYAYLSDNHFTLLPGESRAVRVEWSGAAEPERRLTLRGWNTEGVMT